MESLAKSGKKVAIGSEGDNFLMPVAVRYMADIGVLYYDVDICILYYVVSHRPSDIDADIDATNAAGYNNDQKHWGILIARAVHPARPAMQRSRTISEHAVLHDLHDVRHRGQVRYLPPPRALPHARN